METKIIDAVIVGAGLTGLTTAFYLSKAGKNIIVIDKNNFTGGVIKTGSKNGFTYEYGPNTGVIGSTEIVELFDNLKQTIDVETPDKCANKRLILKNGKWHALPNGLWLGVTTPLFSFTDKLRLCAEPWRKKGIDTNETIANLVIRRMGKSFLDYAVNPFISGIYAGNPGQLVTKYAMPKLFNLEQKYGSFIKGSIKKAREPKSELDKRVSKKVFSTKNGLQSLINTLTTQTGLNKFELGISGLVINKTSNSFIVTFNNNKNQLVTLNTKTVVTTINGINLPGILPFIDKNKIEPISQTQYAKVIQVAVGYNNWDGINIDAFGALIPEKENRQILGILFPSSLFSERAPKNGALLSVFLGGVNKPGLFYKTDSQIEQIVLSEIATLLKTTQKPGLIEIFRYEHAIAQYEVTTGKRLQAITEIESTNKGLFLAGSIRDGIGMADRVKQARMLALKIIGNE